MKNFVKKKTRRNGDAERRASPVRQKKRRKKTMGTRGLLGIVIDGQLKAWYNHYDSYPSGLGQAVSSAIGEILSGPRKKAKWLRLARELVSVPLEDSERPCSEILAETQWAKTRKTLEKRLDAEKKREKKPWESKSKAIEPDSATVQQAVSGTTGNLLAALANGVTLDEAGFAADGLFCEWGYVVNFDDEKLEVYRGFYKTPHACGRFADLPVEATSRGDTYRPIRQILGLPLRFAAEEPWEDDVDLVLHLIHPNDADFDVEDKSGHDVAAAMATYRDFLVGAPETIENPGP
jgi:hypothetical protein